MEQGLMQIYTGDGKGKTTAALGQAMRALGRGLKVVMIQFLKGEETGEVLFIRKHAPGFEICRCNTQKKFPWEMNDAEIELLKKETMEGFGRAKEIVDQNGCDLLILDEVIGALNRTYIPFGELKELLAARPGSMELILTGRGADSKLIAHADLVTEMKNIKHPFEKGIPARVGIEM